MPEDGQVADVDGEAVLRRRPVDRAVAPHPGQPTATRPQFRHTRWKCSWPRDGVVRRGPVAEVRVADQPELLEHLERAVDGRDVHRRRACGPPRAPRRAWRGRAARRRRGSARAAASAGSRSRGALAPVSLMAVRSRPLQPGPEVRLQRLAHRRHVVGVEQVALDVAVEPLAGGDLLGALGPDDRVGPISSLPPSAAPYQISAKPVLCASRSSTLPSGRQRRKPVSIAASRTFSPFSSTIQARAM